MRKKKKHKPLPCPECGAWGTVKETRTKADGSKRRRYECANLHRFTTLETIVPNVKSKNP